MISLAFVAVNTQRPYTLTSMNQLNDDLIEKYQKIYEDDPQSKVFAPLAEAYRRMGLTEEAYNLAHRGVSVHPQFASGLIVYARILIDMKKIEGAEAQLLKAIYSTPDNILAHELLGECKLSRKKYQEALKCYKMVLFLNPHHQKAQDVIKRFESLSAGDFERDVFQMRPLSEIQHSLSSSEAGGQNEAGAPSKPSAALANSSSQLRYISLIDAFLVRNDLSQVQSTLELAEADFPDDPQIKKRRLILNKRKVAAGSYLKVAEDASVIEPKPHRQLLVLRHQIKVLEHLLDKFEDLQQS